MKVKDELICYLETHRGAYVSGQELAGALDVSRNAIWKAMQSLKEEGFAIDAVTNKGYMLARNSLKPTVEGIQSALGDCGDFYTFKVFSEVPSTNTAARELAQAGAREGLVVVAGTQTAGRGRMGRSFYSPADTGIYFSVLLRPEASAQESVLITTAAATAVAEGIEAVCACPTSIKWVNDVFAGDRKVAGILTEAALDLESGGLEYAVLGIGINLYPPKGGFPEALSPIAGALLSAENASGAIKNALIARILENFYRYYHALREKAFLEGYRRRSMLIGREITVHRGNETYPARATGINDECHLLVTLPDGTVRTLSSGEVSVRAI